MIQFTRVAGFSEAFASYDRNDPSGLIGIRDSDFLGAEGSEFLIASHPNPGAIPRIKRCA